MFSRMLVVLFLVCAALFAPSAYAHESKQSGDIIVFLHVNPYDDAVTYKKSTFYVLITKNRYQFPIEACDCAVEVEDDNKNIISTSTMTGVRGNATVPYYFTRPGIYHVTVSGTPKANAGKDTFAPFSLRFDILVERGSWIEYFYDKRILYPTLVVLLIVLYTIKHYFTRKRKHHAAY